MPGPTLKYSKIQIFRPWLNLTGMDHNKLRRIKSDFKTHFNKICHAHMRDMFAADPKRFVNFSLQHDGILLDYAKNRVDQKTIELLIEFAKLNELETWRDKMFKGDKINNTENRAVLHTALRNRGNSRILVDGEDVMPGVNRVLAQMQKFSEQVRNGDWLGFTGNKIKNIVNIGIGGSDLGPKFVVEALRSFKQPDLQFHFVSNVDSEHLMQHLAELNPETTLFVIASKTFTTSETLTNAMSARKWFLNKIGSEAAIARHFVSISTNKTRVSEFGIDTANMFEFWDWVGGRYSLWSAIGLSIMLAVGYEKFIELLAGAYSMDKHFQEAPLNRNMPVILGLLRYWYGTFFNSTSHVVLPYDHLLDSLPDYLQQLDMESNGKSVDRDGNKIDYPTGPIIWGQGGINGQHAFYQLLHQGTRFISADFIIALKTKNDIKPHRDILYANCLAQSEALMRGRTLLETRKLLQAQQLENAEVKNIAPYMVFDGNRPSNTIVLDEVNPYNLGALIALYEHKIFTQGVLLNINSFDQWGVEFGKTLANDILPQLTNSDALQHDSSTNALIERYRALKLEKS